MKKLVIIYIIIIWTTNLYGQETFTFDEFINLLEKKTLVDFDKEIRKRGYSFRGSEKHPNNSTGYTYEIEVESKEGVITTHIEYFYLDDGILSIFLVTNSTNQLNKITDFLYSKECSAPKIETPSKNTILYNYICNKYMVIVSEANNDDEDIRMQSVLISKI